MEGKKLFNYSYARKENPDQRAYFKHIHADYELLFFLSGDAEYHIESTVYPLKTGDLLLIKPRSYHFLQLKSDAPYERFVVNFQSEILPKPLADFLPDAGELYSLSENHLARRLFLEWKEKRERFSEDELDYFVERLIGVTLLSVKTQAFPSPLMPETKNKTLEEILRYIDAHPEEPITASSLSARFFISTSWLVHTFRKELNISLMQFITKKRLLHAQTLVKSGLSPTAVCERCQFSDYSTFYRQYKKFLGATPKSDK